ncbi:hypothetical protein [Actinoallomurus sp. NPDC050550]|uniref:class I mannose-6-phosphate isomerase n=1 Tax=Actinoallomurus sp. NPDC050550 TaxID=3154937 RepID=UPI0033C4E4DD
MMTYEANPRYAAVGGTADQGWPPAIAALPAGPIVLALDGPAVLDWKAAIDGVRAAASARGRTVEPLDLRTYFTSWERILARTASAELPDDPDFATLAGGALSDLFDELPDPRPADDGLIVVYGPGAALVHHDVLWYLDLPKRYVEAAINAGTGRNLGQPEGTGRGTTKRLFYIDWPLLDRHRDTIAGRIDRWFDLQDSRRPTSLSGDTLRRTITALARRPFRTRPTFNTTSWGGHWAQRELGFNPDAPNTALGYELIAPESGVLIGDGPGRQVEVPFQMLVERHPDEIMGREARARFGTSFPIRFDYLDTMSGGNLSVHCHPQPDYMRRVFGWPYTQHETYYIMVGGTDRKVFLGLRGDVDVDKFHRQAHDAHHHEVPMDIEEHVQVLPATPHQLFCIPAGTPHGSGEGNVVLEVSATPYLYSLRFYDWLRRDSANRQRPVHVEHAFRNLDTDRLGEAVTRDLVQTPRSVDEGDGWAEELLGALPEMFFQVRRLVLDPGARLPAATGDRFHVLNVVDGDGVLVTTCAGDEHHLSYAETLVVPAAVGDYTLRSLGSSPVRVVKALIS